MVRLFHVASLSALLVTRTLQGDIGGVPGLTPEQQAVQDAASIKDPDERERSLERAISAGLLAPDHKTRYQVLVYLENNRRWIDLRPFASIVIQFSKIDQNGVSGLWMLDDLELMRAPRSRREDVYRMAIVDGGITLPHGRPLPRKVAIRGACYEGMDSLAPLIREYVKAEYPEEGAKLLTALELGAGAEDREDAIRLSARHLREMDAAAVYDKMAADGDFRSVVTRVTEEGCASNPFLGGKNPGCADMKVVVGHLSAHETEVKRKALAAAGPAARVSSSAFQKSWLDRLNDAVR